MPKDQRHNLKISPTRIKKGKYNIKIFLLNILIMQSSNTVKKIPEFIVKTK